ncbi:thrombopoietin receptor isoform X1 [Alosa pseudoharengus]|uniref:thrombopoietin receptor isoform X1 n=1 Tax=Alosa pseudoharengus TaxID=34774 RepID=UPI003F8A28D3
MLFWMFFVWLQTSWILAQDIGPSVQVSEKELQLLALENDPKCFTRTDYDFTCFWEARDGHSYNFSYAIDDVSETKSQCNLTQWTTASGTVLHICSFPRSHVLLYIPITIKVVDALTNTTVFQREISIDETELPYPPNNISVEKTGKAEQLLVRWKANKHKQYEVRYFSQTEPERRKVIDHDNAVLTSLVSGEVYCVQMRVKSRKKGYWSDLTEPVMAMVPQKAEDTGFLCYTSDLHSIQCQWTKQAQINGSASDEEVTIFYREKNSSRWGNWTLCTKNHGSTPSCSFNGQQSRAIQVSLHEGSGPLSRTFYTEEFTMHNSIKTEPPMGLRAEAGQRLHLQWDCPSEILAKHLIYQIRYHSKDENDWKHFVWNSSRTSTYLHEQASSQYFIQVKSKPYGSFYGGYWSDWSSMLTVEVPSNYGLVFIACIPLAILLLSAVVASVLSQYFSKVKRYLWPPVPRLDKILESFLAERPQWEPTFSIKQCDETPASVLEILSDNPTSSDTIQGNTVCTSGPETGSYNWVAQKEVGGPVVEGCVEAGRDYVTLTSEIIPCLRGNEYVYDDISVSCSAEMQYHCTNTQTLTSPASGLTPTSIFNLSYQLLHEREDGWENENVTHYTNLDSAVTGTA